MIRCLAELSSADGRSAVVLRLGGKQPELTVLHGERTVSCLTFNLVPNLQLAHADARSITARSAVAELTIRQRGPFFDITLKDTATPFVEVEVPLDAHSWYGLGHMMRQKWTLQDMSLEFGPFYPFDNGPTGCNTLCDPTVMSSAGLLLKFDDSSPCLHLGLNAPDTKVPPSRVWTTGSLNQKRALLPLFAHDVKGDRMLRVQSRALYDWPQVDHPWKEDPIVHAARAVVPQLRLTVGAARHVRAACELSLRAMAAQLDAPRQPPPLAFMRAPIWTTWVRYGPEINQARVLDYAREIVQRRYSRCVLEIDDRWSVKYGDLAFDADKFPSPRAMVDQLHRLDFLVTLWVIPFANLDSDAVTNPRTKHFFIHDKDGNVGEFEWWQPTKVAALDLSNDDACAWFVSRLNNLRTTCGIDGFKFDAGEPSFTPPNSMLHDNSRVPADYTRMWVHKVAAQFELSEVRSGVQGCQAETPMTRLLDRYSTWGLENGLASCITSTLTSGILGFPFVLPDMIGGNAYGDDKPDAELMVRWTQLNAALPAVQFSVTPWDFGTECDAHCRAALAWRDHTFWPAIQRTLDAACANFTPIVRPMWWAEQSKAMTRVEDQFMLGDSLLVAPIVEQGATSRDVALPAGWWRRVQLPGVEACHDTAPIRGGRVVEVGAALDDMPVFARTRDL